MGCAMDEDAEWMPWRIIENVMIFFAGGRVDPSTIPYEFFLPMIVVKT